MSEVFDYCHVAELTDRGCKRQANEDWLTHFESPNGLVAVVCDGMGGHVGGQIASHTAVEAIQQFMMQEHCGTPAQLIVEAMNTASAAILKRAAQQPELTGMGSTCVMLIVREGKVYIGSVGDSRVYLIRNHKIRQLTIDQSYVQMLVDVGSITPEQAEHHPRKNEITNALGLKGMQPATVLPDAITPEAGDCFLLCSDGLSGMVSDKDIEKVVSRQSDRTQQERVEELVMRAKRNGGVDNITCQIVEFAVSPNTKNIRSWWEKNLWTLVGVASALCLMIAAAIWYFNSDNQKKDSKHSPEGERRMDTVDSVYTLKPIPSTKKGIFLELTNNTDFDGVKIRQYFATGDTTIIIKSFSLRTIEVTPESDVKVKYSADSTKRFFSLNKKIDEDKKVSVTLRSEKSYKKYIIPLEQEPEGQDPQGTEKQGKAKKARGITEQEYGERSEEEKPKKGIGEDLPSKTDCQIVIKANESNKVITLKSSKGQNTETELFFHDYAFIDKVGYGEQDEGWYKIENNGGKCVITIKNTPQNPIPPQTRDAVINVPTRPDCNDGKGIIIRVKKNP